MVGKKFLLPLWIIPISIYLSAAQPFTYTFESPQFLVGQTTPLLNESPNIGSPTFQASFTSSPNAIAFQITGPTFSSPFSGQSLLAPGPAAPNTLSITLNTPIQDVQLDFALMGPGHLDLHSSGGNISALTTNFQLGTLTFHAASPITQFDLSGFSNNQGTLFAIDNLSMSVPEPCSLVFFLLVSGLCLKRYTHRPAWPLVFA